MLPWDELADRNNRAMVYLLKKEREEQEKEDHAVKLLGIAVGLLWLGAIVLFVMLYYA